MNLHETAPEKSTSSHRSGALTAILWVHPIEQLSRLDKPAMLLGRAEDAAIPLAGDRVSRRHASIRKHEGQWLLRDEGSRNGTRCNGQLVSERPLSENDVLRVGDWVGVVLKLDATHADPSAFFFEPIPGVLAGPRTESLWRQVRTVAHSDLPVVVEGETGTGKEVVGQAIHALSGRAGDCVAVNCAALPEGLVEAQLFGHVKGAFTGAHQSSSGYFGAAHGGTLFLDELLELPLAQQAKLLRAVEEGAVTPIGATQPRSVDVRLIAATQKPLWRLVEERRFRADLQARLSGVVLKLPPLRQRREEVPRLFKRLLDGTPLASVPMRASFVESLCLYNWHMNVRELVQTAHRARVLLSDVPELSATHFRALVGGIRPPHDYDLDTDRTSVPEIADPPDYAATLAPRSEAEAREQDLLGRRRFAWLQRNREHLRTLLASLSHNGGNISQSARELGISRQRAHRLLEVWELLQQGSGHHR